MYSRYYSRSRRQPPEPEKPQSQYQWRTRVNTLMNTSDEPRESKLTSSSHRSYSESDSNQRLRDTTDQMQNYNQMSASKWLRDDKDKNTRCTLPEDVRRERFSRTKSDDHLKTRGVRFRSDDVPTTSKSLDGDDEDDSMSFGKLREKRHLRRKWLNDEESDDSSKSQRRSKHGETDSTDNEESEDGACGGSFDSGLDLRISCSPDDKEDQHRDLVSVPSPSRSSTSNESLRSKYHEDSPVESSNQLASSSSRQIPRALTSDISRSGAIPKRSDLRSFRHDSPETQTESERKDTWDAFWRGKLASYKNKQVDDGEFSCSYPPRESLSDFQSRKQRRREQHNCVDTYEAERNWEDDLKADKDKTADEIPGFSFFSGDSDYMEDILQKVIDAEEIDIKENTKELERYSDALMFPEDPDMNTKPDTHIPNPFLGEIDYSRKNKDPHRKILFSPSLERKRASSLPPRIEDNEDDLTELLFRSWRLKCKQAEEKGNGRDEGKEDEWSCVPSVFLEDVFTLLSPKERHQASQVCRHWYDLFYSPRVWETFILLERTLTKKRFNLYKGYQRELCPWKTQICLKRVGSFFKRIVITPISDYFNLCEFLRVLAAFLEYQVNQGETPMPLLHTFDFTFACATRSSEGLLVHGTGGQILDMIVKLLTQMTNLKHLKVNQLLTDVNEVPEIFTALTQCFCECLSSLEMLNVSKIPYAIPEFAQFRNLIKLTVSPQHLDDEVVVLLAGLNLLHLHIHQDVYTCECVSVHSEAWKLVKEMAPWLQVYLEISGITRSALLIQPRAPVYGVFFRTPYSHLSNEIVSDIVEHYSKTLRYLVQERLPRVHGPRGFDKRCDSSLLFLIRRCQNLHSLVVAERISTSTLILLATEGKNLKTLLVRQNALIKRCDWPTVGELSRDFYGRLRKNALDYDKCWNMMCSILRRRWRPLTDRQFMRLKICPKVDMY